MIHYLCHHCGSRIEKTGVLIATVHSEKKKKIAALLSDANLKIYFASNEKEIFSVLESFSPEIAILEKGLPKVFGFEIFELIKKSPRLKNVHIILVGPESERTGEEPESILSDGDAVLDESAIEARLFSVLSCHPRSDS